MAGACPCSVGQALPGFPAVGHEIQAAQPVPGVPSMGLCPGQAGGARGP